MNGMRVGDKILHVLVQTNQTSNSNGTAMNGRQLSGSLDPSPHMAAAAAVLAAAANQHQGLGAGQADWPLLPPAAASMMW
jgi:hypothetical protein